MGGKPVKSYIEADLIDHTVYSLPLRQQMVNALGATLVMDNVRPGDW